MNDPILSSTFFLTLLMMVGLFFFIRASVKDRTEQVQLLAQQAEESVLRQLQEYFARRAYREEVENTRAEEKKLTFAGFVRPSLFLAIFLSVLASVGLSCLALVLSLLLPAIGNFFWLLLLLAPAAGIFYWVKAGRLEKVFLKVETLDDADEQPQSLITVRGHRDELIQLQQSLPFLVRS